jgi:hypothetical protein
LKKSCSLIVATIIAKHHCIFSFAYFDRSFIELKKSCSLIVATIIAKHHCIFSFAYFDHSFIELKKSWQRNCCNNIVVITPHVEWVLKKPKSRRFLERIQFKKITGPGQFLKIYLYKNPQTRLVCQKIKYPPHTGTNTAAETLIAEEPETLIPEEPETLIPEELETLMVGDVRSWEERDSRERRGMCAWRVCVHIGFCLWKNDLVVYLCMMMMMMSEANSPS